MSGESQDFPSKYLAIVVSRGEKNAHFYTNGLLEFFTSEDDAFAWARNHCSFNRADEVLVMEARRLVRCKPVEFEELSPWR